MSAKNQELYLAVLQNLGIYAHDGCLHRVIGIQDADKLARAGNYEYAEHLVKALADKQERDKQ